MDIQLGNLFQYGMLLYCKVGCPASQNHDQILRLFILMQVSTNKILKFYLLEQ